MESVGVVSLAAADQNGGKRVCSVRGRDDVCRFLENLGFVEGAEVRVLTELSGNLIVAVEGARIAVSRALATHILVH